MFNEIKKIWSRIRGIEQSLKSDVAQLTDVTNIIPHASGDLTDGSDLSKAYAGTPLNATHAEATLLFDGSGNSVVAGKIVTIKEKVYTFVDALTVAPGVEGEVLIGADDTTAMANLMMAINDIGISYGLTHWCTVNADDRFKDYSGANGMIVEAITAGLAGNFHAVSTDIPNAEWQNSGGVLTTTLVGGMVGTLGHVGDRYFPPADPDHFWVAIADNGLTDGNWILVDIQYVNCIVSDYATMGILKTASQLEPYKYYLMYDHACSYNIFDGGTMNIEEEKIGVNEPLLLFAISTSQFDKVAISPLRPNDVIHYSFDILDIRDIAFGNGIDTVNANFKGMIYYRKDTVQNVETHYDFRNVKFRRWAVDAELYEDGVYANYTGHTDGMTTDITLTADVIGVGGNSISLLGDGVKTVAVLISDWNTANSANTVTLTAGDDTQVPSDTFYMTLDDGVDPIAYVAKDVCKSSDGKIYKCITDTTGEGDPTVNTADWILWLDITADAFVSWTADKTLFNIGGITTDNLIINDVTAGVDYDDFETFGDYYNWVKNVSIGMIDLDFGNEDNFYYSSSLNNIIIKTEDDYQSCYSNKIANNSWCNTIYTFYNNIVNAEISYNVIFEARNNEFNGLFNLNIIKEIVQTFSKETFTENVISESMTNVNLYRTVTLNNIVRFNYVNALSVVGSLTFNLATIVQNNNYNSTIYYDKTLGVRLSYLDNDVITYAAVTD